MPIVIQELLASDTLSQATNKINFNFDQLILNGGGPVGPAGPLGPMGPSGGRGPKGTVWYDDSITSPGTDPNTIIIPDLLIDDYYLQSNGTVWKYNGTLWDQTAINLRGPVGPPGNVGLNYAGGFPGTGSIDNQNVSFLSPMPDGITSGANETTNEGIPVLMVGGVASNATPSPGIPTITNAFKLTDTMIKSLDSSLLSLMVHQKDSSSSSIVFMGGGGSLLDNYEQNVLDNLSNIKLDVDDTLTLNIPKPATSPSLVSDLIGFNVNTLKRGQQFFSGKNINLISGSDTNLSLPNEISDISLNINTSNPTNPAKFSVVTTLSSASSNFEVGGRIIFPNSVTKTGSILGDANLINFWGNSVGLYSSLNNYVLAASSDGVKLNSNIKIDLISNEINNISPYIYLPTPGYINSLFVDNLSPSTGGFKFKGNITWASDSQIDPIDTSHRNISITKSGLTSSQSAILIGSLNNNSTPQGDLIATLFKGTTLNSATEFNRLFTSSIRVRNTSVNAGYVGFSIENTSSVIGSSSVGFKLNGIDRHTLNTGDKFHAKEETTSVYNRMHYVRKYLNINPLTEGITTDYQIPEEFIDSTFLDIFIGWDGGPIAVPSQSINNLTFLLPDGLYQGQRLILHVIAAPTRYIDDILSPTIDAKWPTSAAKINIVSSTWQRGLPETILILDVNSATDSTKIGAEGFLELLWIGNTYTTGFQVGPTFTSYSNRRGWIVTNGSKLDPINDGAFISTSQIEFS